MKWSDWKLKVLTYLDVDATRRGIDALRTSYIKAAVIDLKHFVALFNDGTTGAEYADPDLTPFSGHDEKAAEATAMYLKSRLARVVDKDLNLAASFWDDYKRLRRELIRESQDVFLSDGDVRVVDVDRKFGDTLPFSITMEQTEAGEDWTDFTNYKVFFTVKHYASQKDAKALVLMTSAAGGGIIAANKKAYWEVDSAAKLTIGRFRYDVQLQNVPVNRIITIQQGTITLTRDITRGPNQ